MPKEVGDSHFVRPQAATHDDSTGPLPLALTAGPGVVSVSNFQPVLTENHNITPVHDPVDVLMEGNAAPGQAMPVPFTDPSVQGTKDQIETQRSKNLLLQEAKKKNAVFDEDTYNFLASNKRDPTISNRYLQWVMETDATNPAAARLPPDQMKLFDPYDYGTNNYFGKLQSWRNNYHPVADMSDPKNQPPRGTNHFGAGSRGFEFDPEDPQKLPPGRWTMGKGEPRSFNFDHPWTNIKDRPYGDLNTQDINAVTDRAPRDLPAILEREQTILRAHFQEATANDVTPTPERQLQSDVMFDMFSVVPPGYGLGQRNKLFVENEQREAFLRFQNNFFPRADDGPPTGIVAAPWQLQDNIPKDVLGMWVNSDLQRHRAAIGAYNTVVGKTSGSLPGDVVTTASARGLPRPVSFLRPVITNNDPLLPVTEPAGVFLNARGFKHLYSPLSVPTAREVDIEGGGSHLRRRRAMAFVNP